MADKEQAKDPHQSPALDSFIVQSVGQVVWGSEEERDAEGNLRMPCIIGSRMPLEEHSVRSIFDTMDTYGDGIISSNEVAIVLERCGVERDHAQSSARTMINEADEDEGGSVDWEEFRQYLQRCKIMRHLNWQERVFLTFEDPKSSLLSMLLSFTILLLIILSVSAFVLETLPTLLHQPCKGCKPELKPEQKELLDAFELLSVGIFSLEYIIRLFAVRGVAPQFFLTAVVDTDDVKHLMISDKQRDTKKMNENPSPLQMMWIFVKQPMNVIDLLSILPFYAELTAKASGNTNSGASLTILRILRMGRIFRIFKLGKYSVGMEVFYRTVVKSIAAFQILGFLLALACVLFGALLHLAEGGEWYTPDMDCDGELCGIKYPNGAYLRYDNRGENLHPTPFTSVPAASWFVMTTITTVGYGDMYPESDLGRWIAALMMVLGIFSLAMPITVLSSNFTKQYGNALRKQVKQHREIAEAQQRRLVKRLATQQPGTREHKETEANLRVVQGRLRKIMLFISVGKEDWHADAEVVNQANVKVAEDDIKTSPLYQNRSLQDRTNPMASQPQSRSLQPLAPPPSKGQKLTAVADPILYARMEAVERKVDTLGTKIDSLTDALMAVAKSGKHLPVAAIQGTRICV